MNKNDFTTYLLAASYLATKSGQEYIKEKLAFEFRFDVELNQSYDDPSDEGVTFYPEDEGRIFNDQSIEEVTTLLSRSGLIPEWIDINVKSCSKETTTLHLSCAGKYTDQMEKMYYSDRGLASFGVKSPNLPIDWVEGKKFKLGK